MTVQSALNIIEVSWITSVRWWLKDPLNPSANMEISLQPGDMQSSATFPQQVVFPIGRVDPIVMYDIIKLPTINSLPLRFLTDDQYQAFETLRASGHTLLLQAPQQAGQWYIMLGDTKQDALNLQSMREWIASGILIRDVTVSCQVVAAP